MVWGCSLLGFYSRVKTRSYKGHFKGKSDKLLNSFIHFFTVSMYFLVIGGSVLNLQTQKMVNWSLVEHGLDITKYLRHPYLGTKGDMGWGWGKATNRTGVKVFYTKPWGLTPLSSSLLDPLAASCLPR